MVVRRSVPTYPLLLLAGVILAVLVLIAIPKPPALDESAWEPIDVRSTPGSRLAEHQPPSGEWQTSAVRESSVGRSETRVQVVDGRPILGSWALVHHAPDGSSRFRARATRASVISDVSARHAPLEAGRAVAVARAALDGAEMRDKPTEELAYLPDGDDLIPVTMVTVRTWEPLGDWRMAVDGLGDIRAIDNVLCEAATARVFTARPNVPCGDGLVASDAELASSLVDVPLFDLLVGGTLDGARVRVTASFGPQASSVDGRFNFLPSDDEFEQVMCYETISGTLAYVDNIGVRGFSAATFSADARGYAGDNSFFSPTTRVITFGVGGIPDAQDRDIINHELGHALHHYAQPAYASSPSSRAVSEGLADYLAATRADDPRVGEWDAEAYSSACLPYLRRLDVPRRYPDDVTGRVHDDGLILSTALWAIRGRLGALVTDRLMLESLFLLTPDADLHDAAATVLATDHFLYDDAHEGDLRAVFAQWGLDEGRTPIGPSILARATPNPFRSQTSVRYVLPEGGAVRVDIVDVQGRLVATLVNANQLAGSHAVTWDGRAGGRSAAPGLYFYCVGTSASFTTGKILFAP